MSSGRNLLLKNHRIPGKTATNTVISIPKDDDISFWAPGAPKKAEPEKAKQNEQNQRTRSSKIQKTRNPETQEYSDMPCSARGERMSQRASEPEPVIQRGIEPVIQ